MEPVFTCSVHALDRPALLLVGDVTIDLVDGRKAVVRPLTFKEVIKRRELSESRGVLRKSKI